MQRIFPDFLGGRRAAVLLFMRFVMGTAFILHGLPKAANPTGWTDPMGLDVPPFFQAMAVIAEIGGGIALLLGLLTPLAALAIILQMIAALFLVHFPRGDVFVGAPQNSYELPLVYLALGALLMAIGPGKYSLDYLAFGRSAVATQREHRLREA